MTPRSDIRINAGSISLAVTARGERDDPPVIFLHGGGQTRHAWDRTAATLAADHWYTLAVDMRGHGDSGWAPDGDYTLDGLVSDLDHVVASVRRPPVLVGASLGGITALVAEQRAASTYAAALVLVDVAPRLEPTGIDRIRAFMTDRPDGFASLDEAADAIAAYNPHRRTPPSDEGLRRVLRRRADGRWIWHWDPAFMWRRDPAGETVHRPPTDPTLLEAAARSIRIPTLLLRGRDSDLLSERGARHLLDVLPGARYVDVNRAGHMVAGDRNDAFTDELVAFLASLQTTESP